MKEKHLPYFAVLKSLKSKECPFCFLITNAVESYFDSLLYENINDIGFRSKFRNQNGFCNYHTYKFLKYNDLLAISLTHKDLLLQKINQYKRSNKIISNKTKKKQCIICDLAKDAENRYFSVLIEYLEDKEFKSNFLKSAGLCIPHFERITNKFKKIPKWFIDFNRSKYKLLVEHINKFLDACNFSLGEKRPILSKEEGESCRKIVKMLSGYEGMQII